MQHLPEQKDHRSALRWTAEHKTALIAAYATLCVDKPPANDTERLALAEEASLASLPEDRLRTYLTWKAFEECLPLSLVDQAVASLRHRLVSAPSGSAVDAVSSLMALLKSSPLGEHVIAPHLVTLGATLEVARTIDSLAGRLAELEEKQAELRQRAAQREQDYKEREAALQREHQESLQAIAAERHQVHEEEKLLLGMVARSAHVAKVPVLESITPPPSVVKAMTAPVKPEPLKALAQLKVRPWVHIYGWHDKDIGMLLRGGDECAKAMHSGEIKYTAQATGSKRDRLKIPAGCTHLAVNSSNVVHAMAECVEKMGKAHVTSCSGLTTLRQCIVSLVHEAR